MFEEIAQKGEKIGRISIKTEILQWLEKHQDDNDTDFRKAFNEYRKTF